MAKAKTIRRGTMLGRVELKGSTPRGEGTFQLDLRGRKVELRIPGCSRGDLLDVEVDAISQHHPHAWGHAERVHQRGPDFRVPSCSHASQRVIGSPPDAPSPRCGGCPLMHLRGPAQAAAKVAGVRAALEGTSGECMVDALQTRGAGLGYRNRSHFRLFRDDSGELFAGSWAPRSNEAAAMTKCQVVDPAIVAALGELMGWLGEVERELVERLETLTFRAARPPGPGEGAGSAGDTAAPGAQVALDAVVATGGAPSWLVEWYESSSLAGISWSERRGGGNALRDQPSQVLAGSDLLCEQVGPLRLWTSASGFSQLNTDVAGAMYGLAGQWVAQHLAGASPSSAGGVGLGTGGAGGSDVGGKGPVVRIADLYCGVGGLGLAVALAAPAGAHVRGYELSAGAVELARRNAAEAGTAADYEVCDLGAAAPALGEPDVVLVNPPRRGLDRSILDALDAPGFGCCVYMSCSAESFARDLRELERAGWRVAKLEVWDMLPQTAHVELLALLSRN